MKTSEHRILRKKAVVTVERSKLTVFAPLPAVATKLTPQAALGQMLFFEQRLSKNHDLSCNNCHELKAYGVDNVKVSLGHHHQKGPRNAPSVYQAFLHSVQFWDGRAETVETQALMPMQNPKEMANTAQVILQTLGSMPEYVSFFAQVYPQDKPAITMKNLGAAIGAYERTLTTPGPWDRFLAGDDNALSSLQKEGLNLFMATGCQTCHSGILLGGSMLQKLGQVEPWPDQHDRGRYEITHQEADKMVFKVPSLRNVAKTAPYFHDGSVPTLEEAVRLMAKHQLGKTLKPEEIASLVHFLGALTGELPPYNRISNPSLPASRKTTPLANPNF